MDFPGGILRSHKTVLNIISFLRKLWGIFPYSVDTTVMRSRQRPNTTEHPTENQGLIPQLGGKHEFEPILHLKITEEWIFSYGLQASPIFQPICQSVACQMTFLEIYNSTLNIDTHFEDVETEEKGEVST